MAALPRVTTRDGRAVAARITARKPFAAGSLTGRYTPAQGDQRETFVVYSYSEPILVVDYASGEALVSLHQWSVTTSKHQQTAHYASVLTPTIQGPTIRTHERISPYTLRAVRGSESAASYQERRADFEHTLAPRRWVEDVPRPTQKRLQRGR